MEEATEQSRTSLYLVRKVEALAGVVQFFIKNDGATAERKLQFLAQSDFWDWEMDNLIYSFTNFNERQKTWHSFDQTIDKLGDLGILMDAKMLKRVGWRRNRWLVHETTRRAAPIELLTELIAQWNQLVDDAEANYIAPMRESAERFNIQTKRNLNHLRKVLPRELVQPS